MLGLERFISKFADRKLLSTMSNEDYIKEAYKRTEMALSKSDWSGRGQGYNDLQGGITCLNIFLKTLLESKFNNDIIYKINDEFGKHLHKTSVELPVNRIKVDWSLPCVIFESEEKISQVKTKQVYIEFPNSLPMTWDGCLITIVQQRENVDYYRFFFIGKGGAGFNNFLVDYNSVDKDKTAKEIMADVRMKTFGTNDDIPHKHLSANESESLDFCFKVLLYLNSKDPHLENISAQKILTKNPKKVRRFLKNNSIFDTISVGYSFHGDVNYKEGEWPRVGHLGWRTCGEGRKDYRLVWIKPAVCKRNDKLLKKDTENGL